VASQSGLSLNWRPKAPQERVLGQGEVVLIMASFIWLGRPLRLYFSEGSHPPKYEACKGEVINSNSDHI